MKFLYKLLFYLILALTLGCFLYFKGFNLFTQALVKVQTVQSTITHQSDMNLTQLQTASLVQEFVFPYDFISRPNPNWALINLKVANNRPLNSEERELYQFYQLILKQGFDLSLNANNFFIITVKANAGFNLTNNSWFIIDSNSPKNVNITLPPPEILNFEVLDNTNNNLPNIAISPQVWAKLVVVLQPLMLQQIEQQGLLQQATTNSQTLINNLFSQTGFTTTITHQ